MSGFSDITYNGATYYVDDHFGTVLDLLRKVNLASWSRCRCMEVVCVQVRNSVIGNMRQVRMFGWLSRFGMKFGFSTPSPPLTPWR